MKEINPIQHLSGRSYHKKRRYKVIGITLVIIAAAYLLFQFSGKNLRYYLHVKSGVNNLEKGKIIYAVSDFNKALNIKPAGPLALDGLGSIAVKQNDFQKAEKYFTEAISAGLKSNRTINHTDYGSGFLDSGMYKQAEQEFRHAIRLNSVDYKALYGMGCCFHAFGDIDSAISYYSKSLTYNPKYTPARKNLSLAEDDKNKGAIYYIFDRNGEPLVRKNLISYRADKTYILDHKAAHITGFDSERRKRKEGVEKYLETYIPGNKIYLTVDVKAQQAAASALGWYKGSIVIIKPGTGEILALYNQPTFRPNNVDKDWWKILTNKNKPFLNRAIDKLYEPGSIAKLITLAAAFENGINEKDIFPIYCAGSTGSFGKETFWCWQKHGKVKSIEQTLDSSCNIGMAFIGLSVGGPRLSEFNARFGFGYKFDIGFNDPARGTEISIPAKISTAPTQHRNRYEVAMHSCGLSPYDNGSYEITPLHAALLSATIANNGIMMKPHIVKEIRNINGKIIYRAEPEEIKRPITRETAVKLKDLMVTTVEKGIGKKAKVKGVSVAGKTGTSGGDKKGMFHAWFISFAPADNPEYAVAVVGDNEGKGMYVAAPVAGEIYKSLLVE